MTSASCDVCHRSTTWVPATFAHTAVTPNACASCHNGAGAKGKPSGHFAGAQSCDACHRTTAWTPAIAYRHLSPAFKPHSSSVKCASCHTTNNEVIASKFPAYKPDCAACHASRFNPAMHVKAATPRILYTVNELRDCAGSCHEYANSQFTQIKRPLASKHHATDGGF